LGFGTAKKLDWIEVKWPPPSGRIERFKGLTDRKYQRIVEGTGESTK
jgi:hypothetical protein